MLRTLNNLLLILMYLIIKNLTNSIHQNVETSLPRNESHFSLVLIGSTWAQFKMYSNAFFISASISVLRLFPLEYTLIFTQKSFSYLPRIYCWDFLNLSTLQNAFKRVSHICLDFGVEIVSIWVHFNMHLKELLISASIGCWKCLKLSTF